MTKTLTPTTELDLLKQHAEELWAAQQDVFAAAGKIARQAGEQSTAFAREEVAPRVRQAATSSASAVRSAYDRAVPVAANAIATAAALGDQSVRLVLARLAKTRGADVMPVVAAPAKRGIGVAGWIGIAVGVVAVSAVAYAVWQTLRADDDLWIEDEVAEALEDEAAPAE